MKLNQIILFIIIGIIAMPLLFLWKKSRAKEITEFSTENQIKDCPLCSTTNTNYSIYMKDNAWNNRHGVELRKCNLCGFVFSFVSVFDYESFSANETFPAQTKQELFDLAQKENLPMLMNEILKKAQLTGGKSLDFGCGIGLNSICLQKKRFTTYGVELSKIYLEKHKDIDIISAKSLIDFKKEQEGFDLVLMKDVLEHVNNPVQLLTEVLAFVKPGGYFYIRVPNVHHYYFHWSIDTKSHINHFSPQQLMDLLEKNGMEKIDFISVYDISTFVGKIYNSVFWNLRNVLPLYHQISLLYRRKSN